MKMPAREGSNSISDWDSSGWVSSCAMPAALIRESLLCVVWRAPYTLGSGERQKLDGELLL